MDPTRRLFVLHTSVGFSAVGDGHQTLCYALTLAAGPAHRVRIVGRCHPPAHANIRDQGPGDDSLHRQDVDPCSRTPRLAPDGSPVVQVGRPACARHCIRQEPRIRRPGPMRALLGEAGSTHAPTLTPRGRTTERERCTRPGAGSQGHRTQRMHRMWPGAGPQGRTARRGRCTREGRAQEAVGGPAVSTRHTSPVGHHIRRREGQAAAVGGYIARNRLRPRVAVASPFRAESLHSRPPSGPDQLEIQAMGQQPTNCAAVPMLLQHVATSS